LLLRQRRTGWPGVRFLARGGGVRRLTACEGTETMIERDQEELASRSGATGDGWPPRPATFAELLTPVEAAQYLRLDETGSHTPTSAVRTLNYWRDREQLKATRFARRIWYRRAELDRFLAVKTET